MLSDFVLENCTSPGTGVTVSLAGAVTGRKSFAQAFSSGVSVYYFLDDGTQAEWGYGTFTTGTPNTLTRGTVISNTSGTTSRLNFAGTTRIYNSLPASRVPWLDINGKLSLAGLGSLGWLTISKSSASGASSVYLTPPAGFQRFRLTISDVAVSANNTVLGLRFSSNGGSSYYTTGYAYQQTLAINTTTYPSSSGGTAYGYIPISPALAVAGYSVHDGSYEIDPGSASNVAVVRGTSFGVGYLSGVVSCLGQYGGNTNGITWATMNAIQIVASGGTFSGNVLLEGLLT